MNTNERIVKLLTIARDRITASPRLAKGKFGDYQSDTAPVCMMGAFYYASDHTEQCRVKESERMFSVLEREMMEVAPVYPDRYRPSIATVNDSPRFGKRHAIQALNNTIAKFS